MGLARCPLAAPLGFAPSRAFSASLGRDFAPPPLTRFADPTVNCRARRRPRVSIGSHLAPSARRVAAATDKAALLGSCTGAIPHTRACIHPGYEFTSRRVVHYCRPSGALGEDSLALPELPGSAGVPSLGDLNVARSVYHTNPSGATEFPRLGGSHSLAISTCASAAPGK